MSAIDGLRARSRAHTRLEDGQREPRRLGGRVPVGVRHIAGERRRVAGVEGPGLARDVDLDRSLLDVHQLLGARRVRLADVLVPGAEGPVPQLHHVGWLGAGHEHPSPAGLTAPEGRALPPPPPSRLQRVAPSPRRVTLTRRGSGGSTRAGSPTPSASLIRSKVPTLGLTAPCSTLTTIRRLTAAASASRSRVHCRACRSCFTRAPIARASAAVLCSMSAS